jgi:hypothetical protein
MSSPTLLHLLVRRREAEVWGGRIRADQRFWIGSGSQGPISRQLLRRSGPTALNDGPAFLCRRASADVDAPPASRGPEGAQSTERTRFARAASAFRPAWLRACLVARAGVPKLIFSVIRAPSASATFCIRSTPTPA